MYLNSFVNDTIIICMKKNIHQGKNIKRFREMLGIKQEALAWELGEGWNQRRISLLEQKEIIDPDLLEQLAGILKVSVDGILHFDEEVAISMINNTFGSVTDNAPGKIFPIQPLMNPVEQWIRVMEENKNLYERLLQAEKEKNVLLERFINKMHSGKTDEHILEDAIQGYGITKTLFRA